MSVQSARLTSKGQLVIPKTIRDALRVRSGTDFSVSIENERIVLVPRQQKRHRLADWGGFDDKPKALTAKQLSKPVTDYTQE